MTLVPEHVSAEIVALTAADRPPSTGPARTITGLVVEWDTVGQTSAGPTIFAAGSITLPADLSRVKLLLDHDHSRPVGYMIAADQLPEGIRGTFYVPEGTAGDLALAQARDRLRDGMSVGAQILDYGFDESERLVVRASELNETSLVSIPAFRGSIVSDVTASRKDKIVSRSKLMHIAASAAASGEQPAREESSTTVVETTVVEESSTTDPAEESGEESTSSTPSPSTSDRRSDVEAASRTRAAVAGTPAVTPAGRSFGLTAMSRLILDTLRRDESASRVGSVLTAALSDVTPSNIATTDYGPRMPQYVRDLWQAADVARPLVDAFGTRELKSLKVQGHVWKTRPQVAKYAGNKAPIPSNPIERTRQDATAQRFAGGWDVDRVFVDLPSDSDEIEEILTEATRDYLTKSEAYAAELVEAGATPLYGEALSVPAALAMLGSYFARVRGSRLDVIQMGTDAWEDFANMTQADAPWWLRSLGSLSFTTTSATAAGLSFGVNPDLPASEIIAADKRAMTLWEKRPPVKVRAIDIANGGIDIGVFGYMAGLVNDPRLVVNVDTAGRVDPNA